MTSTLAVVGAAAAFALAASALTCGSPVPAGSPTAFDRGIAQFTRLMLGFMAVMVPLVFVINGVTRGTWAEAFFFVPGPAFSSPSNSRRSAGVHGR